MKVKVRSNKATKSKCCLCRATHVLFVIYDAEFDGDTHFEIYPRIGQLQVKLGQICSNFKIQNFLTKLCLSCAVLSQDSKNVIYFHVWQLEMSISHMWRHRLYLFFFFGHCTAKNKDIAFKFCLHVFVCTSITYIPFFGYL